MPHAITSLPLALQMANLLRLCLVVRLTASQPLDLRPRLLGERSAVPGSVVEV
jgi:hypothetical protein